ncbi:BglG family transcription antiterminator [Paenibacillus glucanolyticus]|uniref:BglG family transcription antiterminator n=1 Tax=Paenibacillus glucanolyticus TaxID=59843 RepID=UPI0034CD4717
MKKGAMRLGQITARQRQILLLLMSRTEGMTAAEIAAEIGVSVRTVHREMEEIEKGLQGADVLLHKKSGTGIRLEGETPEGIAQLRKRLLEGKPADYSVEERKILMLCALLEADEPIKLFALAHSLKVTVPTVSSDLDELEPLMKRFKLNLIRRRGYGVELEGTEAVRRRAICRLAEEYLDYSDLVGDGYSDAREPVTARLLSMVGKPVLLDVEKSLWDMNWSWTESLSESAYTSMLIALSVSVKRIRQGRRMEEADIATQDGASSSMEEARDFAVRLGETLEIPFTDSEMKYISNLFEAARDMSEVSELAHTDVEMVEMAHRLIERVQRRTGIPFQEDRTLRAGLVEHIGAAMKRIREGTRIRNPLLSPIRKDYEELFGIVRHSVDELRLGLTIPDEEIGFLVMHFGASSERLNQLGHHLKAILVCSSGLSSSRLLGTRLNKEMPQIEVLGNVSWYEAARMPKEQYDLIISTIDLPLPKDRYVRLSPLLTADDKEALLQYIQSTSVKPGGSGTAVNRIEEQRKAASFERLRLQAALMNAIVSLLDGFHVHDLDNRPDDLEGTLNEALAKVYERGAVSDAGKVKERLLERERMGTQLIPDTTLALFHTRSRYIACPSLTLFRLAHAAPLEDGAEAGVILLMLAPKQLPKESLEVLSEISAMLLGSELIELMERGGEDEIRSYLAEELQHFFNHRP